MDTINEYIKFWKERGIDYIIPPDTKNPEGFNIGSVLRSICTGTTIEIGCGTGRVAKHFHKDDYMGVDINPLAVELARLNCPDHLFSTASLNEEYPQFDNVLLYTVCLHIPDDIIFQQLYTAAKAAKKRVVIAEIMNPKYRDNRAPGNDYDISNQRSLAEYEKYMNDLGMFLSASRLIPYEHYKGEYITFATFERPHE